MDWQARRFWRLSVLLQWFICSEGVDNFFIKILFIWSTFILHVHDINWRIHQKRFIHTTEVTWKEQTRTIFLSFPIGIMYFQYCWAPTLTVLILEFFSILSGVTMFGWEIRLLWGRIYKLGNSTNTYYPPNKKANLKINIWK